uniref:Uncharacterized protein n=1 Tax=Pristionchus pacificus TaxID=54126 RepID=A0A2A6BJ52_PRIPA|eukprot:PDM65856.1 hypothetical protein PRIPAC_44135 [Pristionchus pacificus]
MTMDDSSSLDHHTIYVCGLQGYREKGIGKLIRALETTVEILGVNGEKGMRSEERKEEEREREERGAITTPTTRVERGKEQE